MKKIIMFLMFAILSFNSISANEVKIINTPYKQTQVLKTIFPELVHYHSGWVKQDSVEVVFDFLKNKKIIINDSNFKNEYKIIKMDTVKYEIGESYRMKGIDSKNIKYDIEVLYYNDKNIVFILANDSNVVRYKFVN